MSLEEDAREAARTRAEVEASRRAEGAELVARLGDAGVEPVDLMVTGGEPVRGWILVRCQEESNGFLGLLFMSQVVWGTALTADGLLYRYCFDHKGLQRVRGDQVPFDDADYRSTLMSGMERVLAGTFRHADEPAFSDALPWHRFKARWGGSMLVGVVLLAAAICIGCSTGYAWLAGRF